MLIGIDVGGTKIEGILLKERTILKSVKIPTEKKEKEFVSELISLIESLSSNYRIKGISLCFPGILDRKKGRIVFMPALSKIRNLPIKNILEKKFGLPVKIENDGNCMALGEYFFGCGKPYKNLIVLSIGTGIGGGFIKEGKLFIGNGCAGEFGHITLFPEGYKCFCGSRGCLEEYASGRGIMRLAKEKKLVASNPKEIEELARRGNSVAIDIYKKAGFFLGIGLSTIIKNFDPDAIVLNGSISHAADLFLDETIKAVKKYTWFPFGKIRISKLKSAAALGACSLFQYDSY